MSFITAAEADKNTYDVIVVGSGAAGGQTAYTLTMDGARVLMLEAGRNYNPGTETPMLQTNAEAPLRGSGTPEKPFGFWDATIDGGWDVPGEPYTSASDDPARKFVWWRARMLGGRTNHWGRISLRNGPYDFKPHTRDGLGFDWPMSYEDLAPFYDKVEMLIGVYGSNEGLENTPNSSPGVLLPPPKPRVSDLLVHKHAAKLRIPVIAGHRAVLTRRLDDKLLPKLLHPGNARAQAILAADMKKRAACFWATPCGRGCSIRANYQSTTVHLPPALDTGNLDIVTDAMVRTVTRRKDGGAEGVVYIDRKTGAEHRVKARIVVLAASALESVRILLNSGVANSNGKVGKYIMDTVGANFGGQVPALEGLPPHNEDGADGGHMYVPWWLYKEQLAGALGFARGYHIEFGGGRTMPGMGTGSGLEWLNGGNYGKKFKQDVRRYYGSFVGFAGRGEMIPNDDCYAELDPSVKDKFGIPVLRFHWKWSEHEIRQAAHMQKTAAEIIDAMGGRVSSPPQSGEKAIKQGGIIIHEVGGAMMGNDPAKSVTNSFGRSWEMKNLFITDGATLCSNADKNPTLTIMALAWRSAEHMLGLMKRKEL
jgi:choline dehydrogenase-like flavoprotein